MIELTPLWLSLKLALCTTLILLVISVPLASWLSGRRNVCTIVVETIVSLPLVLPPTVIGFYLLVVFSPANAFGSWLDKWLNIRLVFSFPGLLIASVIYSLPFMVHPIKSGLSSLSPGLKEAAWSLGKTRWQTLFRVLLPNIKPSLLSAIVLSFAHTLGEFGVVLMIGGNIPGATRTASIAIYDAVEVFNYRNANLYAAVLLVLSFVMLMILYAFNNKSQAERMY